MFYQCYFFLFFILIDLICWTSYKFMYEQWKVKWVACLKGPGGAIGQIPALRLLRCVPYNICIVYYVIYVTFPVLPTSGLRQ